MGNTTELVRAVERLRILHRERDGLFNVDENVSVFETTIRVLGGLLSAHQILEAYVVAVPWPDVFTETGQVRWGYDEKKTTKESVAEKDVCTIPALELKTCLEDLSFLRDGCDTSPRSKAQANTTTTTTSTTRLWKYDGFLLNLAQDIGERLYPAFASKTGIPYC